MDLPSCVFTCVVTSGWLYPQECILGARAVNTVSISRCKMLVVRPPPSNVNISNVSLGAQGR